MVTVKDYKPIRNKDGEIFYALIVQSGIEPVKSQQSGRIYFTCRTCSVPTTLDQEACKRVVGSQLQGDINKVSCDPYEYIVESTGEVLELDYRWEYLDHSVDIHSKEQQPLTSMTG